jgi:hypothetical protein
MLETMNAGAGAPAAHGLHEYKTISADVLADIANRHAWIAEPIHRASTFVLGMPYFDYIRSMTDPRQFKSSALQLFYHSATFPKVMGLMLGMTPLSENHMMSFYAGHAFGEATHHQMLFDWMLKHGLVKDFSEVQQVITTPETNACVNLAYQMAVEQDRDKWLVSLNCGIERCSNDFFKAVAPKMHSLGVGDSYFDVHVEADEHHSIMGLDQISTGLSDHRKEVLIAKALEGITLWAAMLHSWLGMTAFPIFDIEGRLAPRKHLVLTA